MIKLNKKRGKCYGIFWKMDEVLIDNGNAKLRNLQKKNWQIGTRNG